VIPHGVREDLFHPEIGHTWYVKRRISFVGFLEKTKGVHLLPEIMNHVWRICPDIRISLIGDGPLRSRLEKYFRDTKFYDRCEFVGAVSRDTVASYLRRSDIFVLPTNLEGFGLAIVEAMMSGAVPVVSRLPGIVDQIIDDEESGILVDRGHSIGFAESIIRLLKDPVTLRSMSKMAREKAVKSFSLARMLDSYEVLFNQSDDRRIMPKRRALGWMGEVSREILRKRVDRTWLINRMREFVRY
jgi:glycosyltransferase involved in cell wall biosynthesis